MTDFPKIGPTGRFPEGQCHPEDKGEILIGITYNPATQNVIIDFGTSVQWLAMPKERALEMAALLIRHAT